MKTSLNDYKTTERKYTTIDPTTNPSRVGCMMTLHLGKRTMKQTKKVNRMKNVRF